jgi:hypothetical protein
MLLEVCFLRAARFYILSYVGSSFSIQLKDLWREEEMHGMCKHG